MMPQTTPITASRRYPSAPLVGVGVAIYNDEGQILLVQSAQPPRAGTWGLPGGLIDLGESLVAAAEREVMEELGVKIEMGGLVTTFEPIYRDSDGRVEYHYVVLEYWARYQSGTAKAQDDAAACAWVDAGELGDYALTPQQLAVLAQTFAAWRAATPPHSPTAATL
jgi:ADP-ribose pyrophosphatase YjhB (NUDIX family)